MKKNYILAFVLSISVVLLWDHFVLRPQRLRETPSPTETSSIPSSPEPVSTSPVVAPSSVPLVERNLEYSLGRQRVTVNLMGGGLAQWSVQEKDLSQAWIDLIPRRIGRPQPLSLFPQTEYKAQQKGNTLLLEGRWESVQVVKRLDIDPNGGFNKLTFTFTNTGKSPVTIPAEVRWGPGIESGEEAGKKDIKGSQRAIVFDGQKVTRLKKPGDYSGSYRWWAVDGHYFIAAFLDTSHSAQKLTVDKDDHYYAIRQTESVTLEPGSSQSMSWSFYVGAKRFADLKTLGSDLDKSIDFGLFAPIGQLIHRILFGLHSGTKNYGWAIILLTLIIQVIVLPLTIKSFNHGQRMKSLQPQLKRIQELYRNDPRRLNSEMMALYQRHGLKFMGMEGCLPMLIQLPIFWALYSTLRNTFELRHAPWMAWIHDLSAHDPFYIFPVLMGAAMFLQQRLTLSTADPTQRQMMYIMPIMFTFIFLKMPSGLVIYWLTNSVVGIIVQMILLKRLKAETKS